MAMRWAGTMLLAAEKRFRRLKGYREMPVLAARLNKTVDTQETVA